MNGCMTNSMKTDAQGSVTWLRCFILAQLQLGLVDARMAEVALHMVEELRVSQLMATMAKAAFTPPIQHETAKAVPLPAAMGSAFMLHDHYAREGKPLRAETGAQRRHRREVTKWREVPVEELLEQSRQRRVQHRAA